MTIAKINTRITTRTSLFVAAKALACIASLLCTPATAAAPFDGAWTVSISTNKGSCDNGSIPIKVSEGRIQSGHPSVAIAGSVAQGGGVRVTVGGGVKKANGSGRLTGSSGSGTWSGGGGMCSGTWVAERN